MILLRADVQNSEQIILMAPKLKQPLLLASLYLQLISCEFQALFRDLRSTLDLGLKVLNEVTISKFFADPASSPLPLRSTTSH